MVASVQTNTVEAVGAGGLDQLAGAMQTSVVAKAFGALADPVRLRIVELLAERGEVSASELGVELPVSQPRVSVHLRCLSDCGFTTVRREGRRAYYQLTGPHIAELVATVRAHADTALPGLLACLQCGPHRPGPDPACC